MLLLRSSKRKPCTPLTRVLEPKFDLTMFDLIKNTDVVGFYRPKPITRLTTNSPRNTKECTNINFDKYKLNQQKTTISFNSLQCTNVRDGGGTNFYGNYIKWSSVRSELDWKRNMGYYYYHIPPGSEKIRIIVFDVLHYDISIHLGRIANQVLFYGEMITKMKSSGYFHDEIEIAWNKPGYGAWGKQEYDDKWFAISARMTTFGISWLYFNVLLDISLLGDDVADTTAVTPQQVLLIQMLTGEIDLNLTKVIPPLIVYASSGSSNQKTKSNADLAVSNADLAVSNADLAVSNADLAVSNADLAVSNASLAVSNVPS